MATHDMGMATELGVDEGPTEAEVRAFWKAVCYAEAHLLERWADNAQLTADSTIFLCGKTKPGLLLELRSAHADAHYFKAAAYRMEALLMRQYAEEFR